MGEMMYGTCEICGKKDVPLERKVYYYGIKCECHSPQHFVAIEHCKDCVPKPPKRITVEMKPVDEN